jgi:RNA polymerase-binding transcription factor DksA
MPEIKQTREQLEKRRAEILAQLSEVNEDERIELERDPEEQAIQIEQHDVAISMEANLRKELITIEDKLLDLEAENKD